MGEYLSPGVYVEEVSSGSKPIAGVGTSTGAFVGIAEKGPIGKAELITNWTQFEKKFGGFVPDAELAHGVYQFFNEGGTKCYVVRTCSYALSSDPTTKAAEPSVATLLDSVDDGAIGVFALNEGTWGDKISASVEPANDDRDLFKLVVSKENAKGEMVAVEAFDNLTTSEVEDVVNGNSDYIKVEKDDWTDHSLTTPKRHDNSGNTTFNHPWTTKFAQSVVLMGGVDAVDPTDPADSSTGVAAVTAKANLMDANFTVAISLESKGNHASQNGTIVTLADGSAAGKFTLQVIHPSGDTEFFEDLAMTGLGVIDSGSLYINVASSEPSKTPWTTRSTQSVALDASGAGKLKSDAGTDIIDLKVVAGFASSAADITVSVEPGDDPGTFHLYVKHAEWPYENFENVTLATLATVDSTYVNVALNSGVNLPSDAVPWPRKTEEVSPIHQSVMLGGGDDGLAAIKSTDYIGSATGGTGLHAFDTVDGINIVAVPDAEGDTNVMKAGLTYCELRKDCFFVADPLKDLKPQEVLKHKLKSLKSSYGALYYPWIESMHPVTGKKILLPPSGAVAGIISKTDVARGVHKAPAGTAEGYMKSAIGLERVLTKGEHDILNNPGINVIREFPGAGICVWGARTLTDDPEWKYVNVRRLFMMIEESIDEGSQWVVFEPNDPSLWGSVKRNITAFLTMLWRDGALYGATPDEAFFVKIDEENNPPEVRDAGQLIIEVGVAPVKPAEFVIIRIQQKTLTK